MSLCATSSEGWGRGRTRSRAVALADSAVAQLTCGLSRLPDENDRMSYELIR